MKHLSFVIAILLVSVLTTACINNFAVKELNEKAKKYINSGDNETAISRLQSGLELDNQVWETHYNLGIAYLNSKQYEKAQKEFEETIKLNPKVIDAYYSMAVAFEEEADDLDDINDEENKDKISEPKFSKEELKEKISQKLQSSIKNYQKYQSLTDKTSDKEEIQEKIQELQRELEEQNQVNKEQI